jgi:hypothetical protein
METKKLHSIKSSVTKIKTLTSFSFVISLFKWHILTYWTSSNVEDVNNENEWAINR